MPNVIADTSVIQYLFQSNNLELLKSLYTQIILPEAVIEELSVGRKLGIHLPDTPSIPWIISQKAQGQMLLPLIPDLGPGEREAIAIAAQTPDSLLLLDDSLARRYANLLNLKLSGTLGILLKCKELGHIDSITPILQQLHSLGFRLNTQTRLAVLKLANER